MIDFLLRFVLFGTAAVAVAVCFFYALWQFLDMGVRAVCNALGPWRAKAPDSRIPHVGPAEPAHLAYWWRQMWVDATTAAGYGMRVIWFAFSGPWVRRNTGSLLRGYRPSGVRGLNWFTRLSMTLVAPGTFVGALTAACLATVLLSLALTPFTVFLGLVWATATSAAWVLRAAERTASSVRGVRVKCPYPGCYRAVPIPVHSCPSCLAPHARLRPGRFGVLWHVCECGRKLVTTRFAGRGKLDAHCPHCDGVLPDTLAATRVVHLPIIGGTSSGKTMFLAALLEGLQAWSRRGALSVSYTSDDDRLAAQSLNQQLKQGDWTHATTGGQPRALMLSIRRGRRRRLLYLYDPMGESLSDAERVRAQQYLAHADGVILLADVLADAQVRVRLTGDDAGRAAAARPSSLGPWETYQRLAGELAALSGRRQKLHVATVVTKRDVLDQLGSLPVLGARIDTWLSEIGLGRLVRALGHDFKESHYWSVSAYTATGAGALESEQRRAAEPVLWLLAATGLRIRTGDEAAGTRQQEERRYTPA